MTVTFVFSSCLKSSLSKYSASINWSRINYLFMQKFFNNSSYIIYHIFVHFIIFKDLCVSITCLSLTSMVHFTLPKSFLKYYYINICFFRIKGWDNYACFLLTIALPKNLISFKATSMKSLIFYLYIFNL